MAILSDTNVFKWIAYRLCVVAKGNARTISRKGIVRDEIKKAAQEENATLVVLGRPAGKLSEFRPSSLLAFAAEIDEKTGAETVIV